MHAGVAWIDGCDIWALQPLEIAMQSDAHSGTWSAFRSNKFRRNQNDAEGTFSRLVSLMLAE
jgi:hypothetical protein